MGLLEEAIREHLELQRRRGADPKRIAVAEEEALQPLVPGQTPAWANGPALFDHEQPSLRAEAADSEPHPFADAPPFEQETAELDMNTVFGERLEQRQGASGLAHAVPDFAPVRARRIVPRESAELNGEADFEWVVPGQASSPPGEQATSRQGSFAFE